jgi:hypothetical protein
MGPDDFLAELGMVLFPWQLFCTLTEVLLSIAYLPIYITVSDLNSVLSGKA